MSENGSQGLQRKRGGGKKGAATPTDEGTPDKYATGYDILALNRDLLDSAFPRVLQCVNEHQKHDKVVLVLVTYGGEANVAYRIGRFLQTAYDEIAAFAPVECKSAGTLIITAAHTVIVSPFGEVGPLDVQLMQRDEIFARRSGLTTRSAIADLKTHTFEMFEYFMTRIVTQSGGAVSFRLAADISGRMASELMSNIYGQINPEALGQDFRDLNVAYKYCERLNKRFGNLKPKAIDRLVYEYPSHDFVIDLQEAKEIFERAELPTPSLIQLMRTHGKDVLVPRTGKESFVEMLTIPGQAVQSPSPEPVTKAQTGSHANDGTTQPSQDGNGGGATPEA
jgi:Serine dehydrogenase proteinase